MLLVVDSLGRLPRLVTVGIGCEVIGTAVGAAIEEVDATWTGTIVLVSLFPKGTETRLVKVSVKISEGKDRNHVPCGRRLSFIPG